MKKKLTKAEIEKIKALKEAKQKAIDENKAINK